MKKGGNCERVFGFFVGLGSHFPPITLHHESQIIFTQYIYIFHTSIASLNYSLLRPIIYSLYIHYINIWRDREEG